MEDLFDLVGTARYFSVLDLELGYYQIKTRDADVSKTPFVSKIGTYEYLRKAFGQVNVPNTFKSLMNTVLEYFLYKICVVYLDDVLVFSRSQE